MSSMRRVGFELTIPELDKAKTVHALDRAVFRGCHVMKFVIM
jgi:hypothetical protein